MSKVIFLNKMKMLSCLGFFFYKGYLVVLHKTDQTVLATFLLPVPKKVKLLGLPLPFHCVRNQHNR